ncbi:MAG: hypothetical protein WCF94_03190 [bacterium]
MYHKSLNILVVVPTSKIYKCLRPRLADFLSGGKKIIAVASTD